MVRSNAFSARTIEKRRICELIQFETSDGKRVVPKADELVIYLYSPELATVDWYVMRAGKKPLIVLSAPRILDYNQRLEDWLRRLEAKIALLDAG